MVKILKYLLYFVMTFWCASTMSLELNEKNEVIESLQAVIADNYVLTENIPQIDKSLLSLNKTLAVSKRTSSEAFASLLTDELKVFDKHFTVQFTQNQPQKAQPEAKESWFEKLDRSNSGFNKVEILKGNVGYLDFWGFDALSDKSKKTVENAMQFLSHSDALIIDLRENGGGSAEMVQFISSYFLPEKTHLNSFYARKAGHTSDFWTFDEVDRIFPENVPVYILVSANTFSAAEEFAYNFKHLGRATIIGQPSKGGANPWQWFDIGHGYRAGIPVAMAINPVTKSNWEGVGVIPHVVIGSEKALPTAYAMALNELFRIEKNKFKLDEISKKLGELSSSAIKE